METPNGPRRTKFSSSSNSGSKQSGSRSNGDDKYSDLRRLSAPLPRGDPRSPRPEPPPLNQTFRIVSIRSITNDNTEAWHDIIPHQHDHREWDLTCEIDVSDRPRTFLTIILQKRTKNLDEDNRVVYRQWLLTDQNIISCLDDSVDRAFQPKQWIEGLHVMPMDIQYLEAHVGHDVLMEYFGTIGRMVMARVAIKLDERVSDRMDSPRLKKKTDVEELADWVGDHLQRGAETEIILVKPLGVDREFTGKAWIRAYDRKYEEATQVSE